MENSWRFSHTHRLFPSLSIHIHAISQVPLYILIVSPTVMTVMTSADTVDCRTSRPTFGLFTDPIGRFSM